MALIHTRRLLPSSVTINIGGSNAATDEYLISDDSQGGVSRTQALAYSAAGYPSVGSQHPEIPNLFANSITFRSEGRSQVATWSYAPRAGGAIQRIPLDLISENFVSMEITSSTKMVELPQYQLVKKTGKGPEDQVVENFVWESIEARPLRINIHTFTVLLSGEFPDGLNINQFFAQFDTINQRENELHTFAGKQYLFRPRYIKQRTVLTPPDPATGQPGEPARWEVQYSWDYDPGIRNTFGTNGMPGATANGLHFRGPVTINGIPLFTRAIVCQDLVYALRPFQSVDIYPNLVETDQPPIVDFWSTYRPNPNGWQTLPGIA